jgi:alpha-N-arabinofuranosidase
MKTNFYLSTLFLLSSALCMQAQTNEMHIQTQTSKAVVPSTMYGAFFEDINFAADGGLYAEMVKNRSFEYPQHLMGWNSFGKVEVRDDGPFPHCPHYVRLSDAGHHEKHTGLDNEGFFGIAFRQGETYHFSVWARLPKGDSEAKLNIQLVDKNALGRQSQGSSTLVVNSPKWKKYVLTLTPSSTVAKGTLRILLEGTATVDLEHISLFPTDTWKGHANGLRKDLAQALADMHPGVMRFPGGCIVEGTDRATRYDWKNTVGPVENRPLNEDRWNYSSTDRLFPDYFQSCGLGFFEFFQLAEEIGAEPLPVLNCGMICQFQNNDPKVQVPVDSLAPYIQDALDLIEFANGSADSKWGKVRADMGHPQPFNLKFIAIGNEQWGPEYTCRLEPFVKAIRKAYPHIKILGSAGPSPDGKQFDYLWPEMRRIGVDLVDEHFYRNEDWFLSQGTRYEKYPRKGPKVFAGEYACHAKGKGYNHFNAALMEAAFMTDLERNADVVNMASYAPLFAHVEGWQWRPDLIWYDNLHTYRTCSYYVQQLYSLYKGTNVLPLTMDKKVVAGLEGQNGLFASAVIDKNSKEIIVKVANVSDTAQPLSLVFDKLKTDQSDVRCITLHSDNPDAENILQPSDVVRPVENTLSLQGNKLATEIGAKTFAVYIIKK